MKIIAIILVIIAIVYFIVAALVALQYMTLPAIMAEMMAYVGFVTFGAMEIFLFGLGAFAIASIVDKDTAVQFFNKATESLGELVGNVVGGAGKVISGVGSGVVSALTSAGSALLPLALAIGGFLLWKSLSKDKPKPSPQDTSRNGGDLGYQPSV